MVNLGSKESDHSYGLSERKLLRQRTAKKKPGTTKDLRSQKEQQEKRYKVTVDENDGKFKCRASFKEFSSHVFAKNHTAVI